MSGKLTTDDRNVPLGTVADFEGQPRTPKRNYACLVLPAMTLEESGVDDLEAIIADYRRELAAFKERQAADAALDAEHAAWRDGEDG